MRADDDGPAGAKVPAMRGPPIPQRMPPLQWRQPSFIWTPVALAAAIGWPAAAFASAPLLQRLAVFAGAAVFALALLTLGASWALGRAPRTRRIVVLHVVFAGAVAALAAPFVLTLVTGPERLQAVADGGVSLALTPLALVLGLPIAFISGTLFAWIALSRPGSASELDDGVLGPPDVQPFR